MRSINRLKCPELTVPLGTRRWSRVEVAGLSPPGRYNHTMNLVDGKIFLFGGEDDGTFFGDVWTIDLELRKVFQFWLTFARLTFPQLDQRHLPGPVAPWILSSRLVLDPTIYHSHGKAKPICRNSPFFCT